MKKDIIIVGGGAIGLSCAYQLVKQGRKVTIIDKNDINNGTSFGNAGLVSCFGKNPLSAPGIILDTMKLMLKGQSPMNFHPSTDWKLYRWLLKFASSANEKRLEKTLALFEKYGRLSLDIYSKMTNEDKMDFYFHQDGLLMIYTEQESFDKKVKISQDKEKYIILSKDETKEYMPCANDKIIGSVLLKGNGHLDPGLMMKELKNHLVSSGVEFILNEEVEKLEFSQNKVSKIITNKNAYVSDMFILSTGWNDSLARQAKNDFIITPAKGYSITFEMAEELRPKTCALFADQFIAMTPRKDTVRVTSKLELGTHNSEVIEKQIESIKHNLSLFTNDFEMKNAVEWTGFRPLPPDDMPILGYDKTYSNLVHATGLGWLGITFAPSIGYIISNLIMNEKSNKKSSDILLFSQFYQV
jgi:D-amino-acid dehydrogenase